MELFKTIKDFLHPDPMAVRLWNADPLVIVDFEGEVVFSGKSEIEATPLDVEKFNLKTTELEPELQLNDATRVPSAESLLNIGSPSYQTLQGGTRAGEVFEGVDQDGEPATWFMGRAADSFLLENAK